MEVEREGAPVSLGGAKQTALLAVLLVHVNRTVSTDRLVDALWGEHAPSGAIGTLHTYLSHLRSALEPDRPKRAPGQVLVTAPPGYVLRVGETEVDAAVFGVQFDEARAALAAGDGGRALERVIASLELWRGDAYGELAHKDFARAEAVRLEELRVAALEVRGDAQLILGHHAEVVGQVEGLLAEHPLQERLWAQLMLALYRSGRQAEALRAFHEARTRLGEIGIEPSNELRLLEDRILQQDSGLDWAAPGSTKPERRPSGRPTPTGIVTYLMTDVEDSTNLWEEDPAAMATALKLHDEVVRNCCASRDGYIFSTAGDAFAVAFSSPLAAVEAAVEIQQRLAESSALRVRMGIHTGDAEERDGDYFGPSVNRVARLSSAGHGGQIVVSLSAQQVLRDLLPPDIRLRDLGEHRLGDLTRTERVYQVEHPDLIATFPRLELVGALPTNLPTRLSSFVGRRMAIREVMGQLAEHRLLTLIGIGGAGKTRLAIEVGAESLASFDHGVWFVDLSSIADEELVISEVASALGLQRWAEQPLLETVSAFISKRRMLLVLDNCEHVLGACADLADSLLATAPALSILATSREPFDVAGEQVYPVATLSLPDPNDVSLESVAQSESAQLFVERAAAILPGFDLDEDNFSAVAEIVNGLDGIPLAIELAAARVRVLTPNEISQRLEDRFKLLTGGSRSALPRHQTLRAAIDWSYALLPSDQRLLFTAISVFRGGFTLEAVREVTGIDEFTTLDGLTDLLDKSLVAKEAEAGRPSRFRMLETLRQFAGERLMESERASTVRDGHADFFIGLAKTAESDLRGPGQAATFSLLETEHDNLRAAFDWTLQSGRIDEALHMAAALTWFWFVHRHMTEGRNRLAQALGQASEASDDATARARWGAGFLAGGQGDYLEAEEQLLQSLELHQSLGEARAVAVARHDLGMVAVYADEYSKARTLLETARLEFVELGDDWGAAWCDYFLGRIAVAGDEDEQARQLFLGALQRFRGAGDTFYIAWSATHLGDAARRTGRLDEAAAYHEESLVLFEELDDKVGLVFSLAGLGVVAHEKGDHDRAAELHRQAMEYSSLSSDIATALAGMRLETH